MIIKPEQLCGLKEAEYLEIVRFVVKEYEDLDANHNKLCNDHQTLHNLYEAQMNTIKESLSQKLNPSHHNLSSNSVGAFEVVEEAVRELSIQHEEEIKSIRHAKDQEIESITKSLVATDNGYLIDQIDTLKECLAEVASYMDCDFAAPYSVEELCQQAKHTVISTHAVQIAEMESKHMIQLNQYKVDSEETLKKQELAHAYSRQDLIAEYDQRLLDKDDSYQERLQMMDEKVYCLESELTMLKGDLSVGSVKELNSSSNEFIVHVSEHASNRTDSNKVCEEKSKTQPSPRPVKKVIRKSPRRNKPTNPSAQSNHSASSRVRTPDNDRRVVHAAVQTEQEPTQSHDTDNEGKKTGGTSAADRTNNTTLDSTKFKSQVDQIEAYWKDLMPMDDSFDLAECSVQMMDESVSADKQHAEEQIPRHLGLEELDDTDILPLEYISPSQEDMTSCSPSDVITTPDDVTHGHHGDLLPNDSPDSGLYGGEASSRDLFEKTAPEDDEDELISPELISPVPDDVTTSHGDVTYPGNLGNETLNPGNLGNETLNSPCKMVGRILALQAANEVLQNEVGTNGDLNEILASKIQAIEERNLTIAGLREETRHLAGALEQAREDSKRANLLNMIHTDKAICRDVQQPTTTDTGSSPVGEDTPAKSNISMLLSRLNLDETRQGNRSYDSVVDTTAGGPDLSLFDLTLTTGLSDTNQDQATLINHLCDIQSEAMKIHDRSEELCRENEKLHNQIISVGKELEVEKGKVKIKIKELMEERDKCKRLEAQLTANNEHHAKRMDELAKKLEKEEALRKKHQNTIKANKEIHKRKLDEVFAFHQKELTEMAAKQELSEQQAKGLAKLINLEPENKTLVSTDCQTSMIFSNFVLHMSTDSQKSDCPDNDNEYLKQQLTQAERDFERLKVHTRDLEEKSSDLETDNSSLRDRNRELEEQVEEGEVTYSRYHQESLNLITMTNQEKLYLEQQIERLREEVIESEELMSCALPPNNHTDLPTMPLQDPPCAMDETQQSTDTVNYTCLTNDKVPLPEATRYLVGVYKTATEQVQELEEALQNRDSKLNSLVATNSALSKQISQYEQELKSIKLKMADADEIRRKLLDANKQIARLKGEILSLSTEAQNAHLNDNHADDALIEENEELKLKVEKLEEIKHTLMTDIQSLRDQLDEEQLVNEQASKEMIDANDFIGNLKAQQEKLEEDLKKSQDKNSLLEETISSLETQLSELQNQIKREKNAAKELIEKAEDASTVKTRQRRDMEELREKNRELEDIIEQLRSEIRKGKHDKEDQADQIASLQRKLGKLQPSLDSYEEENQKLKDELRSHQKNKLKLKEELDDLQTDNAGLHEDVNTSLKLKLKDAKDKLTTHEQEVEDRDNEIRNLTRELHEVKEELGSSEEKVEKLQSALDELKTKLNVRKKSTGAQAVLSMYDVGSTCHLLASSLDPELPQNYEKLQSDMEQMTKELGRIRQEMDQVTQQLENSVRVRGELEGQLDSVNLQRTSSDSQLLKLQQDHVRSLETLRQSLTLEKDSALETLRLQTETDKQKLEQKHREETERREVESKKQLEVVIGEMEQKRGHDCTLIANKVGLDPTTLTTLPDSTQLTDRIEALHQQAVQIRNLALDFYEASHRPARDVAVQAGVKVFKCSTQTSGQLEPDKRDPEGKPLDDLIRVFKEEHDKQTEVLLRQLKVKPDQAPSPSNEQTMSQLKDELQRLRLSLETYTTRCAILEHNNRLLKDRNNGLENDLMANVTHNTSMLANQDEMYNSHVQQHVHRGEPREIRKRMAECQNEIGKLQGTIAEYQEGMEQLEIELEHEREERKSAEKRMRSAESAVIEMRNDYLLTNDMQHESASTELEQARESCRIYEAENQKLKKNNGKLKDLNNNLKETNKHLKQSDILNVSSKSNNLIQEIDNLKVAEDLRLEVLSRDTDLGKKESRISVLESEVSTRCDMIAAQKDEMESKEKVIKLIKSELSAQQLDMAELKSMLEIERMRSNELDRRLKSSDLRQLDDSQVRDELQRLRSENSELSQERGDFTHQRARTTKAYLKFLKAESARKALVFQKQYLLGLLAKARAVENAALSILEIKKEDTNKKRPTLKHVAVLVVASVRMKKLVLKWKKVKESLEEKQRRPTSHHTISKMSDMKSLNSQNELKPMNYARSPSPVGRVISTNSIHSGLPKWDSSRPISPSRHPREGITSRVYGSPSPDPSLSRLDQQLARLRHTINTRAAYNDHPKADTSRDRPRDVITKSSSRDLSSRVTPERDCGATKPSSEDDGTGTLSDISNYISRLEAVQSRLTDLKLSSYKIQYDSNKSLNY